VNVFVVVDVQYLFSSATNTKKWMDLKKLIARIRAEYQEASLITFRAYLLSDKEETSPVERILKDLGCETSVRQVYTRPTNLMSASHDVKIVLDVVDKLETTDLFVLVLGKASYTDLLQRCHLYRKRVHIWGFETSVSPQLVSGCDGVYYIESMGVLDASKRK